MQTCSRCHSLKYHQTLDNDKCNKNSPGHTSHQISASWCKLVNNGERQCKKNYGGYWAGGF